LYVSGKFGSPFGAVMANFGTISSHAWGSPHPQSRGASPPDLPGNVWDGFAEDLFSMFSLHWGHSRHGCPGRESRRHAAVQQTRCSQRQVAGLRALPRVMTRSSHVLPTPAGGWGSTNAVTSSGMARSTLEEPLRWHESSTL